MAAMAVMAAMADVETARRRCDQKVSVKNSQQKSWAKRTTSFFGFDEDQCTYAFNHRSVVKVAVYQQISEMNIVLTTTQLRFLPGRTMQKANSNHQRKIHIHSFEPLNDPTIFL